MTTTPCAAGAAAGAATPCEGSPLAHVVRYRPNDYGGTMGCRHHATLLQAAHPGSVIVDGPAAIATMATFGTHPDLLRLDHALDALYGHPEGD